MGHYLINRMTEWQFLDHRLNGLIFTEWSISRWTWMGWIYSCYKDMYRILFSPKPIRWAEELQADNNYCKRVVEYFTTRCNLVAFPGPGGGGIYQTLEPKPVRLWKSLLHCRKKIFKQVQIKFASASFSQRNAVVRRAAWRRWWGITCKYERSTARRPTVCAAF